jgi:hypothetical protein
VQSKGGGRFAKGRRALRPHLPPHMRKGRRGGPLFPSDYPFMGSKAAHLWAAKEEELFPSDYPFMGSKAAH